NGRLARDILDAAARGADGREADGREERRTFASRLAYRIYETSASLRARQQALLGNDAVVSAGDARRPAATLARDFPDGVRGFVLTNEVPDAFGVHKVVMTPGGDARVALVLPRVEAALQASLQATAAALGDRIAGVDAS